MTTFADHGIDIPANVSGPNVKTKCPKCSHTRKHRYDKPLSVQIEKGVWRCHNCGWKGGLGNDWRDNVFGIGRRETPRVYTKPEPIASDLPVPVIQWFGKRGITETTLRRNKVTAKGNAVLFPYFRDGELVNVKRRTMDKRFSMVAGAERIFYGLDDCAGADDVIVVEGEIDKLSLDEAGFLHVLSVPDGAPAPGTTEYTSKFDFMDSAADIFERAQIVVLAVDNDEPGKRLEEELARRIGREKCFRVTWPEGCKDANDVLTQHGSAVLEQCIQDARPFPIAGVVMVMDLRDDVFALYRDGSQRGESTGWYSVDQLYTVKTGQMTILTGIPGSGKSEWLDALMVNLARESGWSFAVFSPENFPPQRHVQKWLEKLSGKPFRDGPTPRMTETEVDEWLTFCDQHLQFLIPEEPTIDEILSLAKAQVFRMGIKGIVLDPWNEVDHSRPKEMSETEYISRILSEFRRFCRQYDVHGWISAHPRMLQKDKDTGTYTVPTMYEIAGSANWFNKADNGIAIWRNKAEPEKPIEVHVQKIRFREIGQLGVAYLNYDRLTGRYTCTGEYDTAGGKR